MSLETRRRATDIAEFNLKRNNDNVSLRLDLDEEGITRILTQVKKEILDEVSVLCVGQRTGAFAQKDSYKRMN